MYMYVSGNPQPEAMGSTLICLQPESGAGAIKVWHYVYRTCAMQQDASRRVHS